MGTLSAALRRKYRRPEDALAALGLDPGLLKLGPVVGDSAEELRRMKKMPTRRAAQAAGALAHYLRPAFALDAKHPRPVTAMDLLPAFAGVTGANLAEKRGEIARAVATAFKGRKLAKGYTRQLAMDQATPDDVILKLVDMVAGGGGEGGGGEEEGEEGLDASVSQEQHGAMAAAAKGEGNLGIPKQVGQEFMDKDKGKSFDDGEGEEKAKDDDVCGKVCEFLKSKGVDPAVIEELKGVLTSGGGGVAEDSEENPNENTVIREGGVVGHHDVANDQPPDFAGMPKPGGSMVGGGLGGKDSRMGKDADMPKGANVVSKPAMDAAIRDAVAAERRLQRDIYEARAEVRPYVGELTLALDSVEQVYRAALAGMGKSDDDLAGINVPGLKALLKAQPVPGSRAAPRDNRPAMDSATTSSFTKRNPDVARIRVL